MRLKVPIGTDIFDDETGALHASLLSDGESALLASGGLGGRGNVTFKSSTNRTPIQHQPGQSGDERKFRMALRILADVGLLGLPNAGKSTLLNALTNAKSKTGVYPFATLRPQLGVAELKDFSQLVIADLPGLVEGASEGVGLGTRFLMHATRTNVLLHLVDASSADVDTIIAKQKIIINELALLGNAAIDAKPYLLILNKIDLLEEGVAQDLVAKLRKGLKSNLVFAISSLERTGTSELLEEVALLARKESHVQVA